MEDNKSVKTLSTLGIAMTIIMPFIIGALGLEQSSLIATAQSREITLHGKGSGTWSYQLGTLHKDAKVIVKITDALTYTGDHFYAFVLETNSSSQRWQSDWVELTNEHQNSVYYSTPKRVHACSYYECKRADINVYRRGSSILLRA